MAHLSPHLTVMTNAARKAARSLRRDYFEVDVLQVRAKGAADFVSSADVAAEDILFEELKKARPKYGFIMEERGEVEGADNSNRWIVDPIDGTTNFLHGIPHFAISIGLERDRQPHAGVIFNPITEELFYAEKGEGAYCNDRRLRVSGRSDMNESIFATGLPYMGRPGREQALQETDRVLDKTAGIRRFGAASLDLAMVAQGRFDGYWERGIQSWDVTAGLVLVQEAGGMIGTIEGHGKPHDGASVIATNAELFEKLQKTLRG